MRGRAGRFAALFALLGSAFLAACAAGGSAPEIAVRDDNFRPYREYTTGKQLVSTYPNTFAAELIGRVDRKTGATTTLISADFAYQDDRMRKYESARDARAEALPLQGISRVRSCEQHVCVHEEKFAVEIPEDALRRAPAGGYQPKIFARDGGDTTVTIPKGQIDLLLAALHKQSPQDAAPTN